MFDHIVNENLGKTDREILHKILGLQYFIISKLSLMQTDVAALTANVSTLEGLVGQLITLFQTYAQQIQSGIDAEDLAAIQAANTSLTAEIATVQAALPAPVTPPSTPAA